MIVTLVASFYILEPFSQNRSPLAPSWADQEDHTSTAILSQTANNDPHQGEPRVRQATMIYEADVNNTVYERSVATHIAHGAQWGNPTHILRREIVEAGFFNKPAFLLGLLIEEMAKPIEKRADWIV